MSIIDLRDLAKELGELRDLTEAEPLVEEARRALDADPLDAEQRARLEVLEELERDLGGDLHRFAENEPTAIPEDEFEDSRPRLRPTTSARCQRAPSGPPTTSTGRPPPMS